MGRTDDEYDDEYDDDEYEDEYDDEHDDGYVLPPGRHHGRAALAAAGDPMAEAGHFVRRQAAVRPPQLQAGLAPPGAGAGGTAALQRIREDRDREFFRRGFLWGAGVVGGALGLVMAVVALTDGGSARRAQMAQRELERMRALAEDGDAEPGEMRVAEIMALIAGPGSPDMQLELARQQEALGTLSSADMEWVERAAQLAGEGPVNANMLSVTRAPAGDASEPGPDVFVKGKKTTMSKRDVREMEGEDLDGRDLGLGKLARIQRQNRQTMGKANEVGKAMLKAGGRDPDAVDVDQAVGDLE